ncbi:sugar ABC transporter permease [Streptomyces spiroverticillatus]|uniref:Sugar ABC transporter permease n=1 Tax=Streptomyces finlayi TaxID=67296 RepID=A0A918WUY5_9ACTN|nr:sugar ABC transporter permease [Streptomyces finlayi]GHA02262.1 sugar ABC transporter permease [Streptomyces spiroverticillatus]GHC86482.1 sugar ABC transporter permease [Streptomyces finlayi]
MTSTTLARTGEPATPPNSPKSRPAGGRVRATARTRRAWAGWTFSLPFLVLYAVFELVPVIASIAISFTDMRSTDLRDPLAVDPAGLDNYSRLLSDEVFWKAIGNTFYFTAVSVPLTLVLGLALAVALNSGIARFKTFFRVGYYLPVVSSIIAVAVVWNYLLKDDMGLINTALGWVGIDGPDWLNSTTWAIPALIGMAVWRHMGFAMVIFLAGLQGVPKEMYEAATLDGTTKWQAFRYITLPMLRPTMLFMVVISMIGNLQFFEEPFVMTQGEPLDSTTSIAYQIYEAFGTGQYGYAAAMSYVLFILIAGLTLIQFRLLREKP